MITNEDKAATMDLQKHIFCAALQGLISNQLIVQHIDDIDTDHYMVTLVKIAWRIAEEANGRFVKLNDDLNKLINKQ